MYLRCRTNNNDVFFSIDLLKNYFSVLNGSSSCIKKLSAVTLVCIIYELFTQLSYNHVGVEIGHEIISTVILLPSTDSFKKGCCQLQAKVCARSTG